MKTKDKAYPKRTTAFLAGSIVSLWLVTSPVAGFSAPEKDGGCDAHEKWMDRPVEAAAADYESELMVEDWMTRPFDAVDAVFESELFVEDWMTRPFDLTDAISEPELMVEDWMTRPFNRTDSEFGAG